MRIDLHTHTDHSFDCRIPIEELIRTAEKNRLDAIAICDHDTMSAIGIAEKISDRILIIPGMEMSCENGIHIVGLFLKGEIVSKNILDVIDEIHSQGGLALLPHPFRPNSGLLYGRYKNGLLSGEETGKVLSKVDLIEAVNFRCPGEAMLETDRYLKSYPGLPQVAVSGAHTVSEVGRAFLELENFKPVTIGDIKMALLHTPCLLRFEVYNPEVGIETRKIIIPSLGRKLIWKAKRVFHLPSRISTKRIFRKSPERPIKDLERETNEKSR